MIGKCAKTTVVCWIESPTGEVFVGTNLCRNPQETCPRLPGEGYEKCHSICQQIGHAEEVAVMASEEQDAYVAGGTAYITGHTYACENCKRILELTGITDIRIVP